MYVCIHTFWCKQWLRSVAWSMISHFFWLGRSVISGSIRAIWAAMTRGIRGARGDLSTTGIFMRPGGWLLWDFYVMIGWLVIVIYETVPEEMDLGIFDHWWIVLCITIMWSQWEDESLLANSLFCAEYLRLTIIKHEYITTTPKKTEFGKFPLK